jgi:hypothetical protein
MGAYIFGGMVGGATQIISAHCGYSLTQQILLIISFSYLASALYLRDK